MTRSSVTIRTLILTVLGVVFFAASVNGQGFGRRSGAGQGPGHGFRGGRGSDSRHTEDHEVFHYLLSHHKQIKRSVKELKNGVVTTTESDEPSVAAKIKEHVKWMKHRVENNHPIRMRDPLFRELFRHANSIDMKLVETEKGVQVTETSDDAHVAKLIKAHAKVVSDFVARGFDEAKENHDVPERAPVGSKSKLSFPRIHHYGQIVPLPRATQQPRPGSLVVVDVTKGGDWKQLNPAIAKLARFVNIYAGAGERAADARISAVLHGDATLTVLGHDAYAKRFGGERNPNIDCLKQLRDAGVEIYVCGQSLHAKGGKSEEVDSTVQVAVSALTSLVNLQSDGYAYVPLK